MTRRCCTQTSSRNRAVSRPGSRPACGNLEAAARRHLAGEPSAEAVEIRVVRTTGMHHALAAAPQATQLSEATAYAAQMA